MYKAWLVARHEYVKRVRQKSFIISTLAIPVLIVTVMGIGILIAISAVSRLPVGYVDQAGVLVDPVPAPERPGPRPVEMRAFPDEAAARAALTASEIQAYYVLPTDYLQSGQVRLYYLESAPDGTVQRNFQAFVRANLVRHLPEPIQERLLDGSTLTLRTPDGQRSLSPDNFIGIVLPIVAGFFFFMAVMTASGYMLQAVTDEKENRTVEVLILSLTPEQLIGGKAFGLMGVVLTQLGLWTLAAVVGILVGAQFLEPLRNFSVPWEMLLIIALYLLPSYAIVAGLMTTIGAITSDLQQGQQIAGIVNLLFIFPFFFSAFLFINPNHPLMVLLTLLPTTTFVTLMMRIGITVVPLWQIGVSWVLVMASALGSVWLAARVFRVGMLSYGQRLGLKHIAAALRRAR